MKTIILYTKTFVILILAVGIAGCGEDWLDVKPNRQLIVPTTLNDLGLLLRDELTMNNDHIALMQVSADEYYLDDARYNALTTPIERNAYIWKADIYEGQESLSDWDNSYNQVLTANVIIEKLEDIDRLPDNADEWDHVKGAALFFRGKAFFNLARTFAKVYDPATSRTDPGIPVRTASDVNLKNVRHSVEETYAAILKDLKNAVKHLPSHVEYTTDVSKAAAYGMLARCYLAMAMYSEAGSYADSTLLQVDDLMDYNSLSTTASLPFPRFNSETIQFAQISPLLSVFIYLRDNVVPAELYNAYDDDDLRKILFFHHLGSGRYSFKGSYQGSITPFSGLATDEMYLIRAESRARAGDTQGAMDDLNTLLQKRYRTGIYVNRAASTAQEALDIVLAERRKELIGRGLRWSDLKRLNREPRYAVTLSRTVNGETYTLEPGDPRYVFSIPDYVIERSGMEQNPR